jgi:transcriptional regulator with XRE-family HTH domain
MTKLEYFRRSRGWSQETLARRLGAGFTGSSISLLESLRLKPSAKQERRLREAFGTDPSALLEPIDGVALPFSEAISL